MSRITLLFFICAIIGTGSSARRRANSSAFSPFGSITTAQLGISSRGMEPPPSMEMLFSTVTVFSWFREEISQAVSWAWAHNSSLLLDSIFNTGIFSQASSSFRYSRKVAARAAIVHLSRRKARISGCSSISFIYDCFPAIIPACGPPRSLSPEKQTISAPF